MKLKNANNVNNKKEEVDYLPANSEKKTIRIITGRQFIGPIPPADEFRRYGEVIPDAPERILKIFELDSQHTREMQKIALKAETSRDTRAQWMSFCIMVAALAVMVISIIYGNTLAGIFTGVATLFLALRVLFIKKKEK